MAETGLTQSGLGGVWFTGTEDFDGVTKKSDAVIPALDNAYAEYLPYTEDVERLTTAMAAAPVRQSLNVMSYLGYPVSGNVYPAAGEGDGSSAEDCFKRFNMEDMAVYVPYLFDKKQAYTMRGMPPAYTPTKQVYIIRHGDGIRYSKVQLSDVYYERGTPSLFVLRLRYTPVSDE
jgi:hypothetical protein